ncbi:MAG: M23 family metallopeptidase [Candidatus Omnitrophota bacterium]|jgi:murein DD-endopeptidase MepM/ murein hydrolase activator NlpD
MKRIILFLFIIFSVYIFISLYFLDKTYFLCPIEYKDAIIIRNDAWGDGFFSAKRSGGRVHDGIDLLAEVGTPVSAARSGIVVKATQSKGMGKFVIIRHPGNLTTIYGHLSEIYVHKNEFVRQGRLIGRVGKTGNANLGAIQAHLHLEVRINGIPHDPMEYLE